MLSSTPFQTSSSNCCFRSCTASRILFCSLFFFSDFTNLFQSPLYHGPGVFIGLPTEAISSAMTRTSDSLFQLSSPRSTQVPLLSLATRDLFPNRPGCWLLPLVLRTSTPHQQGRTASRSSCASLSLTSLHFSLSWLFFKTARFFFTLDLDLRSEGEGEEEKDTLIPRLEI